MPAKNIYTKPLRILSFAMQMVKERLIAKAYPQTPFPNFENFVSKVRRQNERSIYASASELYYAAFFGRDSIEAAEDLLQKDPSFARELIPLLASHQGIQYNLLTEEEPGRIHHEYRMSPKTYFETTGEHLPKKVADIYSVLADQWNGNDREMTYYGSVDATPLYIKLTGEYINQTKDISLLEEIYIDKQGNEKTIKQSLIEAIHWVTNRIIKGPREDIISLIKYPQPAKRLPLLEFQPYTPQGIPNQMWKDSQTAVIHEDGSLPNRDYPIATIELQGHAYDALLYASDILEKEYPDEVKVWKDLTNKIKDVILQTFWLPGKNYFAMAIDHDKDGNYRLVKTPTSDQTELLNTKLFDTLPEREKSKYVEGITNCAYSNDFLTDVGIRCRSLAYDKLVDFWDYHGSRAVWIKATYDFARGLDRQGLYRLADQLKIRILNGTRISGNFIELFYVSPNGKIAYDPLGKKKSKYYEEIAATTIPESFQTWTASAVAAIEYDFSHPQQKEKPVSWKTALEDKLLYELPTVALITSPRKAYKAFPKGYGYKVNTEKGRKYEEAFRKSRMATSR